MAILLFVTAIGPGEVPDSTVLNQLKPSAFSRSTGNCAFWVARRRKIRANNIWFRWREVSHRPRILADY